MPGLDPHIARLLQRDAESAIHKENVTDLTPNEAAAICFFAGLPYTFNESGNITFQSVGLTKRDGKWIAATHARGTRQA